MKTLLTFLLIAASALAQDRPAPLVSPDIAGPRVAFRIRAPQAKEVALRGQWSKEAVPMTRGVTAAAVSLHSAP